MPGIREKAEKLKDDCERVQRAMEESDGAARPNGSMFQHWFAEIPGWFHPFGDLPDGQALRGQQSTVLQEVCKALNKDWPPPPGFRNTLANNNPELAEVGNIKSDLSGWTGIAATNFSTNYLSRFDSFTRNLYTAAFVAHHALGAEAELWETAHKDIHRIIDEAQRTVDAMLAGCLAEGFNFALTVLPSVIDVATAPPGEKALTVVQEAAGAAELFTSSDGSAKTPAELMEPLKKSVDELKKDLKAKEQEIKEAIDANVGYLEKEKDEYVAAPVAWDLAQSDDKGHEKSGEDTLGDDRRP